MEDLLPPPILPAAPTSLHALPECCAAVGQESWSLGEVCFTPTLQWNCKEHWKALHLLCWIVQSTAESTAAFTSGTWEPPLHQSTASPQLYSDDCSRQWEVGSTHVFCTCNHLCVLPYIQSPFTHSLGPVPPLASHVRLCSPISWQELCAFLTS